MQPISRSRKALHRQATTLRLSEEIAIDLGPHEDLVGIEILDASQQLGFEKVKPFIELENIRVA